MLVMMMVGGGTWAYFSDTESSNNNVLAAGTLDLTINDTDTNYQILNLSNKAPGDSGQAYAKLKNVGSLPGEFDLGKSDANKLTVTNIQGTGGTEFELNPPGQTGELGAQAKMALWIDVNKNGVWDAGTDIGLKNNGTLYTTGSLDYQSIDSYNNKYWGGANGITTLTAGEEVYFFISWQIPTIATNLIQGDKAEVSAAFILEQTTVD